MVWKRVVVVVPVVVVVVVVVVVMIMIIVTILFFAVRPQLQEKRSTKLSESCDTLLEVSVQRTGTIQNGSSLCALEHHWPFLPGRQ